MDTLDQWIEHQYSRSIEGMLLSISCSTVKTRPGFAQTITALPGSVVASPIAASYDPEPDYFFHWFRDSAIVIDALRLVHEDAATAVDALPRFADFVRFSLSLKRLDGNTLAQGAGTWRRRVAPDFIKYLRNDSDLAAVNGSNVAAETRVNPDATLDISRWSRPQYDGAALRALALLRWLRSIPTAGDLAHDVHALLRDDLEFTYQHRCDPCFDIWEEENGFHYYSMRVAAAALEAGAPWMESQGESGRAGEYQAAGAAILSKLDEYWLAERHFYRSRIPTSDRPTPDQPTSDRPTSEQPSPKELDIAVILAAIHCGGDGAVHTVHDPRMAETLAQLEAIFAAQYPINRDLPVGRQPAMGRYAGDVYYSGGAYYFSTLAAAEFCFRAAARRGGCAALTARGDGFLETVRTFTPQSGELSEQFDQRNGAQTSARQLAWSHAAFISCIAARRSVNPASAEVCSAPIR